MRISDWSSDVCSSDLFRLVIGVLYGFQPYLRPTGIFIGMSRAIANGVNVGQAGPAESIDIDAIAAACSRSEQRRCFGNDANADDDHVCGDSFSARQKAGRSEEHTSELQSLMRLSYSVFCFIYHFIF